MKLYFPLFLLTLTTTTISCQQAPKDTAATTVQVKTSTITTSGKTIGARFSTPEGFSRTPFKSTSFGHHLRNLPLKAANEAVLYYDGTEKSNYNTYAAVVDLPIGKRDLHQCADAVMRLRADYLRAQNRLNDIQFNFTNGFTVKYSEWLKGKRMIVKGNKTYWATGTQPRTNSQNNYWEYLELIFTYAGTLSLNKELRPTPITDAKVGDILIIGGSPGHAVIIVDECINKLTGEKRFLLAQSYMPAQELQVLQNPNSSDNWYSFKDATQIQTPEWTFTKNDLKRF